MDLVRYTGSDDWSALYVDGKLDRIGDHYLIDERISELTGVTDYSSDDFLQGGDDRDSAAQTLEELNAWVARDKAETADEALQYAAELRRQADEAYAHAEQLAGRSLR